MPKPNFVKKPMDKILDEPLGKLQGPKREPYQRHPKHRYGHRSIFDATEFDLEQELADLDIFPVDRDGLKD